MALLLQPSTELEAVNTMLQAIGEQPVNSLSGNRVSEASIARQVLHDVSRSVQTMGLNCNSESGYVLPVNSDKNIIIPNDALSIDATDPYADIVVRGNRLYDRANHTFEFNASVEVDIIFFLAFTDLPQVVRNYITIKAARIFQQNALGSESLYKMSAEDEQAAYLLFKRAEISSGDYNILNNAVVNDITTR